MEIFADGELLKGSTNQLISKIIKKFNRASFVWSNCQFFLEEIIDKIYRGNASCGYFFNFVFVIESKTVVNVKPAI